MNTTIDVNRIEGIVDIYDAIAKTAGVRDDFIINYDCSKCWVSEEIADKVASTYTEKEAFAMDWLMYGPKVDEKLSGGEVKIDLGFFNLTENGAILYKGVFA